MKILSLKLLAIIVAALFSTAAQTQAQQVNPVKVDVVMSKMQAKPGDTLMAKLNFVIDDTWHIYAENPGDAGLPTKFLLVPNTDASTDKIDWPAAQTFNLPGNITVYGYTKQVSLNLPVKLTSTVETGKELLLEFDAKWAACNESLCIPASKHFKESIKIIK